MDVLIYSILGVTIGAIFCIYRRYLMALFRKRRRVRERVAYMIWSAAQFGRE
jgi:hypothetical protein